MMMRRLKGTILLLSVTCPVFAQSFTVGGKIEMDKGNLLLIARRVNGPDTLAKAPIDNGAFTLRGEVSEAVPAMLMVEGYTGGFMLFVEPGVRLTATLTKNGDGDIRGGRLQDTYMEYREIVNRTNARMGGIKKEMAEASAAKHFKTLAELQARLEKEQQAGKAKMMKLLDKNADNVFAAYVYTNGLEQVTDVKMLRGLYDGMTEGARATEPGKMLAARIRNLEQVAIASTAPDFTLPTPEGEAVSLYGVKGKLKIVDFWASWCGPCRMENPNMVKLYNDFKDKGLAVVSVSLDERKAPWVQAIEKDGMPWIHVSSLKGWKCEVVKTYNVDAVPFILVLDEDNRILAKQIRAEKLRAFVEEYLSGNGMK